METDGRPFRTQFGPSGADHLEEMNRSPADAWGSGGRGVQTNDWALFRGAGAALGDSRSRWGRRSNDYSAAAPAARRIGGRVGRTWSRGGTRLAGAPG